MRVVEHWNWLLREAVDASFSEVFRARLYWTLSNLTLLKMFLPMAGGLECMTFKSPFQPKLFSGSVKKPLQSPCGAIPSWLWSRNHTWCPRTGP